MPLVDEISKVFKGKNGKECIISPKVDLDLVVHVLFAADGHYYQKYSFAPNKTDISSPEHPSHTETCNAFF